MSSFICSSITFNSIEKRLLDLQTKSDFYSLNVSQEDISNIFENLKKINVLCVCLQYKHHYDGKLDQEIENQTQIILEDKRFKEISNYQAFSCINCVKYQIEIEHLKELRSLTAQEERSLAFLEEFKKRLAYYLVENSAKYGKTTWEI